VLATFAVSACYLPLVRPIGHVKEFAKRDTWFGQRPWRTAGAKRGHEEGEVRRLKTRKLEPLNSSKILDLFPIVI
jgi:hypothetical protein